MTNSYVFTQKEAGMIKLDELRKLSAAALEDPTFRDSNKHWEFVNAMRENIDALLDIAEAALSVCSENGAREYLLCYSQGARLLEALEKLK